MEIHLDKKIADKRWAKDAKDIVRKCVHCGFCNATCPTYQLLGHESDGPRGRIYLITQLLEGKPADTQTREHLDRCLLCRACETTCPSGVKYGQLLETGREMLEQQQQRSGLDGWTRKALTTIVPNVNLMQTGVNLVNPMRRLLPKVLQTQMPLAGKNLQRPQSSHARKMLLLEGCVQSNLTPETNAATARVLDGFGISLIPEPHNSCCGGVRLHTSDREKGLLDVKKRIDSWWPEIEAGAEAIISTASGCGVTIKEYGDLLKNDPEYAEKASTVADLAVDLCEVVAAEIIKPPLQQQAPKDIKIAFQSPCTLQHGQKLAGKVEDILRARGYTLLPIKDSHLCCGSAGTYSMLQPAISKQLKTNKLKHLQSDSPDIIATANIGCQLHLRKDTNVPVVHWIELLDN